jgi:hypothetical protein
MPDRYWVGGTADWNGTAGTKWALTSGGAGGQAVPTTADDVYFDASSTGTCTIATGNTGAKSINCTGFTGTITGTAAITVAGSITLVAGQTYTHTGTVTLTGTGTLTTAGKTFSGVTVNGSGITVTLGDALNTGSRILTITQGTFDTANYNVTTGAITVSGSTTRVVNLGSSNVVVSGSGGCNFSGTNITVNAGTSTIQGTAGFTFNGGGNTFYNVSNTANSTAGFTLLGANTFNNLTISGNIARALLLGDNQTVNGTLTCAGENFSTHIFVFSDTIGTTRTITANAISANDCDFRDITLAGTAAGASPTRAGDCGGNSGIVFPAAKTVYRVGTNTTWAGSSSWALTSGGTGSNDNFPLAQDTVVIDNNTALTGTLGLGRVNLTTLDASTRTTGITLNHFNVLNYYGDYTLGSGVTVSGTSNQTFSGRGTETFTSAGKTITFPLTVEKPAGAFELGDAYVSSNRVTLTRGTLDAENYNVTCTDFVSNSGDTRTLTMGSGLWTLSGTGNVWNLGTTATNITFNKDTADILLSDTSSTARTFIGGGLTYNKLTIGGATGTSVLTLSGNNTIAELASTKTVAHTITLNANGLTIDTWTVTGTSGNVVTFNSSSVGGRRTFTLTNATSGIDYMDVKDIGVTDANRFYVGANSIDSGNNLNVIFTAAPAITATGNFFMLFP